MPMPGQTDDDSDLSQSMRTATRKRSWIWR